MKDIVDLTSTLQYVSRNFGPIFQDLKAHLATMANAWSHVEEKEQKLDDRSNKILDKMMKLEGVSPFEALEVVTILMIEKHKLQAFYQASLNLRK